MQEKIRKQETLEEAADRYFPFAEKIGGETYTAYRGFMEGAKWQAERMYSEKEVYNLLEQAMKDAYDYQLEWHYNGDYKDLKKWFEQVKKK